MKPTFCLISLLAAFSLSASAGDNYSTSDYGIYDEDIPTYGNYGGTEGSPAQLRMDRARKFNTTLGTVSLGGELAVGYRSLYIYRGFDVGADSCWDAQASVGLALNDKMMLNVGAYALKSTAGSNFADAGLYGDLSWYLTPKTTLTFGLAGHDYSNSYFDDGVDIASSIRHELGKNFFVKLGGLYDSGQDGWYYFGEFGFSPKLNDKARLNLTAGASGVSNYLWRNGYNDTYLKASLSYALGNRLVIEPYMGAAFIEEDSENKLFGGVSLQFNF